MNLMASPESLPIAVRAYAHKPKKHKRTRQHGRQPIGPSDRVLIFDIETTTNALQQPKFGAYQARKSGKLREAGFIYDPSLDDSELATLRAYADAHDLEVLTVKDFVEGVFFPYAYELGAYCVGFNLPFDLSRIAIDHNSARGSMRGGFSLELSKHKWRPRIQIKHLNNRSALIRFTVPHGQRTSRTRRKRGRKVPARRGHFVDVRTLAGALLGGSWSLERLAENLDTEHKKLGTEEHGGPVTEEYLQYATRDVQVTWECFEQLRKQYESYELTETPVEKIYSEASLGKAYLRQMGVRPWRELQPNFPPELLGIIMSTYYGGRSEVHIRREVSQVLYCDFLSMYPTACTLMKLWPFVIAEGIKWRDATEEVQRFLEDVTLEDLQSPEAWRMLCALVRIRPEGDIVPVRGHYREESQYSIGTNPLTHDEPLWYTLADCVADKLLAGKTPKVLKALRFEPVGVQDDLKPINIACNSDYRVDPYQDDFYKRLIDLRSEVKAKLKAAKKAGDEALAARLEAEQRALKLCANATSYGIFVELNVTEQDKPQEVTCFGPSGQGFKTRVRNLERPGPYFHPLLATLITGGARLMLAITEHLAEQSGISWAFCDTDSMALAKPEEMDEAEFLERAKRVREWFTPLNPYEHKGSLFKLEDANYRVEGGKLVDQLGPLYCLAISAKRYALFNVDKRGHSALRKVSAHGLGHLLPPYEDKEAPRNIPKPVVLLSELEAERWQHDLWYRIVEAALGDTPEQVRLDDLPGFQKPAVSRYAATTPNLLRWFKEHNRDKPYQEQVKPFGFLLAYHPNPLSFAKTGSKPVSAYDKNLDRAVTGCFDRQSGEPVEPQALKTYQEALAQYHLHPEAKFHNGDYLDRGITHRRHIVATAVEHIGKEANRWEEQFYVGLDHEAQTDYGLAPEDSERVLSTLRVACDQLGQRAVAKSVRMSLRDVSALVQGKRKPTPLMLTKLYRMVPRLE